MSRMSNTITLKPYKVTLPDEVTEQMRIAERSKMVIENNNLKQDIINHFHIRQGEKLSDPSFGTIIWDVLFEPLTEQMKDLIIQNITRVISSDPRVTVNNVTVDQYESGLQVECSLIYRPYNISETMRLQFDENAGFIAS